MECADDSSSITSTDAESPLTSDSDREGDDELTDWPGIEDLKVFNKSLTFKSPPRPAGAMPPPKQPRKEKLLVKSGWASCKNRFKNKRAKVEAGGECDVAMSELGGLRAPDGFASFSDVRRAGGKGENADETFFESFREFEERAAILEAGAADECCAGGREIRAGCRRGARGERPGFVIQSACAEQLARFLQDARRPELQLPPPPDRCEADKLRSLARLYSLELRTEDDRTVLKKTSQTTQAVPVERSYAQLVSDHKRRCYGECAAAAAAAAPPDVLSSALASANVDKDVD